MAGRGRPRKPDAKTPAQRAREYRQRKRAANELGEKIRNEATILQSVVATMRNNGMVRGQEAHWMGLRIAAAARHWEEYAREEIWVERMLAQDEVDVLRDELALARRLLNKHGISVTDVNVTKKS